MKNWIVKSIRAVVFADRDAFLWIQHKLGFSGYQMAALAWFKGIVLGLLLGWWIFECDQRSKLQAICIPGAP